MRYRSSSRQLDPFLRGLFMDEIDRAVLLEIVQERRAEGCTIATVKRDLTFLSGVCDWAQAQEYLSDNPVLTYLLANRRFLREKAAIIRIPTDEELARLVARAPGNFKHLIRFLEATGIRQEEAASVEHSQIDWTQQTLYLPKTKTHRSRLISLSDAAWQIYRKVPRHNASSYVFWHGAAGKRYRNVASRFAALAEVSGYANTCHALRHRFACRFIWAGGRKEVLQQILGHASIKTTERYIRNVESAIVQDAELRRIGQRSASLDAAAPRLGVL